MLSRAVVHLYRKIANTLLCRLLKFIPDKRRIFPLVLMRNECPGKCVEENDPSAKLLLFYPTPNFCDVRNRVSSPQFHLDKDNSIVTGQTGHVDSFASPSRRPILFPFEFFPLNLLRQTILKIPGEIGRPTLFLHHTPPLARGTASRNARRFEKTLGCLPRRTSAWPCGPVPGRRQSR